MAMTDFVRRSVQIVAGGIAQSTTDYFDNATTFVNDVKEVIDMGRQMGSDGVKKFNELKNSGILKKTRDWFYNEGGMFGDFDFDDDDFDAGFEIDSADSESNTDSSKPLSKDMMSDIAKKQTGAMYKAFGRQADLHIANTAEIISTINTRTAELTASVNNVNNTLIQIGKRLDLIVEWTAARTKKEEEKEIRNASILDYGGGISLSGVINKAKENAEDSTLGTFMSLGKTMLGSGMMTPETVMSMILSQTILDKKWDKLGGKSVNEIGEFINDTVGEVVQNTMTRILTSKNEMLETLFEDIISRAGGKNYQSSVKNTYDDKPAVFDGMTRKSIITVIPGYLNEILKAVNNGKGMQVDSKGNLTHKKSDSFVKKVADSYFRSGTMEYKQRERAATHTGLTSQEVTNAVRTLTGCWMWYMYGRGGVILEIGEVKNIAYASTKNVVENASRMMASADPKKRSIEEWILLYQGIIEEIDEFKYRQELQKIAERADNELEGFAKTHVNNHQARLIDSNVIMEAFRQNFSEFNKDPKFHTPGETNSSANPTQIGSTNASTTITTFDYVSGIFNQLNRGLNVFITGQNRRQKSPYEPIKIKPGFGKDANNFVTTPASNVSETVNNATDPIVNTANMLVTAATGGKGKEYDDAPDRIKDILDTPEDQRTPAQVKELKKYRASKTGNFIKSGFGLVKNKVSKYVEDSRKMGIVADPESYQLFSDIVDNVKKAISDIIPEKFKKKVDEVKESETYQNIANSETVGKVKSGLTSAKTKGKDLLMGKISTDEEGDMVRTGGILHAVAKPMSKLGTGVENLALKVTPTSVLKSRTKKLMDEYSPDKTFDKSNSDALNMQMLTNDINIVMSNGEVSTIDEQNVRRTMAAIQDPVLRRRLNQSVIPLMKRNSKSANKGGDSDKVEPESPMKQLLTIALGAAKMIIAPIKLIVKGAITSIFAIAKYGLGNIFKLSRKLIKNANVRLMSGLKSFAHGAKQAFKPLTNALGKFVNKLYSGLTKINKFFSGIKNGITNAFASLKNKGKSKPEPSNAPKVEKTGFMSKIGNKIKNSEFGKGFTKSMNDSKAAQERAKIKQDAEGVKQGVDQSQLAEAIQHEDGKVPFFKKIINLIKGIKENTDNIPKDENVDKTGQSNQETSMGDTTTTPDIADDDNISDTQTAKPKASKNKAATPDINASSPKMTSSVTQAGGSVASAAKGGIGGVMGGIGEMLGGMANIWMALLQYVISIVMAMEGVKVFMEMIQSILKAALEPISEIIMGINDLLKPFIKSIGKVLKEITNVVKTIVKSITDVIEPLIEGLLTPVLEALMPMFQTIIDILTPILKLIGSTIKVILAPLFALFKSKLVPAINVIVDALQIIMGLVQIVSGVLMTIGGAITSILGTIVGGLGKFIPGLGKVGSSMQAKGEEMSNSGPEMVMEGMKAVGQGGVNLALDMASFMTYGLTDAVLGRNQENEETKEAKKIEPGDSNVVETTFANGDVTNIYNNGSSDIYNTYGGEYQRGMGGYLNMNQRGCGPIALADMYNRSGGGISARSLAGSMYSSGRYSPRRGTSVGDYIDTARSMGMNLKPGKVTQQSLKLASPTHPITVVGSGSDYGTRRGNNHFMNVIGTDSHGTAYVSNPLTGRIDRKPTSTVAGSAVIGLYGSGDEEDGGYTFPQAIKDAFQKLKSEAAKILGLFTMEKSEEEEANDIINDTIKKESANNSAQQMKQSDPDLYKKYEDAAKEKARVDYETRYPKKDGQTDADYEAGFESFWNTNAHTYLSNAVVNDVVFGDAVANNLNEKSGYDKIASTSSTIIDSFNEKVKNLNAVAKEGASIAESAGSSSGSGGNGYFTSDEGVPLWVPYGDNIQITETDISKGNAHSPLFEFFAKTMGLNLGDIYGSGWFTKYNNPDKKGVGSDGGEHSGVDFTGTSILGKPLYATTGGKVVANWTSDQSGGGGNTVVWKDSAGKYHWYMHMNDRSTLNVGDDIDGGDLIGYAGNTGHSTGPHLHYTINDNISGSGSGNVYNPLLYFGNFNPTGGEFGVALGDTDEEKIYSYLTTSGMTPIGASGLMGCFKYESDMRSNNLENSYNDQFGMSDTEYTSAVDSGRETENQFITGRNATAWAGQTPGEAVGYGIAQFTSSNLKRDIYNRTVKQGGSISKLEPQLDAIISVLKDRGIYDTINNAATPTDANKTFLWKYEAGTGYTSDAAVLKAYPWMLNSNPDGTVLRHLYAEQVYNTYKNWKPQSATHGFTNSSGNVIINSAGDAKMYKNLQTTGSTSGKGTGIVITQTDQLNVRKDKSINSEIIGHLNSGDKIEIEACNSNDWLYVPSLGGYVSADFINVLTSDAQSNDWGVDKYSGKINSASDAKYAKYGYGTKTYNITNTGSSGNKIDHTGDAQWYKTTSGEWKYDDQVFASDDPRWRSAWYNESPPTHYNEAYDAYDSLGHMVMLGTNSNLRGGTYYNNLLSGYGGDKDAVKSLHDEMMTGDDWKQARDKYIMTGKKNRINTLFVDDLWNLHNAFWPNNKLSRGDMETRVRGSGDMSELDFWNDYLGWNNIYGNSNLMTPNPNSSDILDMGSETYYDESTGTTVVNNQYTVTRGEDRATEERLRTILANTYNVRSESMEALLRAILEELKKRKDPKGGGNNTNGSQKLFNERIPSQVTKLSIG